MRATFWAAIARVCPPTVNNYKSSSQAVFMRMGAEDK